MVGLANIGGQPGMTTRIDSIENQVWWGHENLQIEDPFPKIASTAIDAGSSPTTLLRGGLILSKLDAGDNLWAEYDPTQTDGREVAQGVLMRAVSMLDTRTGIVEDKRWFILSGGLLKADELHGLDALARQQLSSRFIFDDDIPGAGWLGPHYREVEKAANYTVVAGDNFTEFVATAAADFTLPAIAPGLRMKFRNQADTTMAVVSAEGTNIVAIDNLAATRLEFSTVDQLIGAALLLYTNELGTLWIAEDRSAGVATITVT